MTAPLLAIDHLAALLDRAGPGTERRLSDLLAHVADAGNPVFLTDAVRNRANTDDPVLSTAYRDVLPPRHAAGSEWFADLVVYHPGELPGGELHRSTGHWNTPTQLEIFQTLWGRILMITAWWASTRRPTLRYQVCNPGTLAAVPFGAWHLTLVLDGPAGVFNLYTDLPGTPQALTARRHAHSERLKYGSRTAVPISAIRTSRGFALTGSPGGLAVWGTGEPDVEPAWLPGIIGNRSLDAFYTDANPHTLANLCTTACTNLPTANRPEHR